MYNIYNNDDFIILSNRILDIDNDNYDNANNNYNDCDDNDLCNDNISLIDLFCLYYNIDKNDKHIDGARTNGRKNTNNINKKKYLTKQEALYLLGFDEDEYEII